MLSYERGTPVARFGNIKCDDFDFRTLKTLTFENPFGAVAGRRGPFSQSAIKLTFYLS